ncbi:ATP-binding cassette domain-containing protein [Streptomyces sp. 4N509B]|uniref:ATP-binding cassette domain-containing protein n=1 Tax=Streptomyces sp. 4N509B TaxID=3457413 RepID=UPI003FD545DC
MTTGSDTEPDRAPGPSPDPAPVPAPGTSGTVVEDTHDEVPGQATGQTPGQAGQTPGQAASRYDAEATLRLGGGTAAPRPEPGAAPVPGQGPDPGAGRAAAPEAALRFEGVHKRFPNGTTALADVHLSVAPGEFVAVVGPSGCGKSTLLRLASRLDTPTAGTVHVGGTSLGYVFQDPTLLPWRRVLANVELPAELTGVGRAERRARAREALRLVGLEGAERQLPRELSGGMRMRVSLARALMTRPDVFLFDEPFGALDEITRMRLQEELQRILSEQRFAGLFITHSVIEATFLASRVVVMTARPGRVVAAFDVPFPHPRPPELRYDPAFARIAGEVSAALRDGAGEPAVQGGSPQ